MFRLDCKKGFFAVVLFVVSSFALVADELTITVHFIAHQESFRSTPYLDQAGNWTIGYGHLLSEEPSEDMKITEEEAEKWLTLRVKNIISLIDRTVDVNLQDEQVAALASLAYNIGSNAFERADLIDMINMKDSVGLIATEWLTWNHVTINGEHEVSPGLDRRRLVEIGLYFFGSTVLH